MGSQQGHKAQGIKATDMTDAKHDPNERIVRRLRAGDGAVYRSIRLEALRHAPEAFGSTYAVEEQRTLAEFEHRVKTGCIFGAFAGDHIIGMAGFYQETGEKFKHKGVLWGMFVGQGARNLGVGEALVGAVLDHAKDQVDLVSLTVVSNNRSALALYAKMGFRTYGVLERALKHDGQYFSETLMVRD